VITCANNASVTTFAVVNFEGIVAEEDAVAERAFKEG
jgi:hypothetical protein